MALITPEYARRTFVRVEWTDRRERIPNDFGPAEARGECARCGAAWNEFNHTAANCEKEIARNTK